MEQTIVADIYAVRKDTKRFLKQLQEDATVDNVELVGTMKNAGALHLRVTCIDRTGDICGEDWLKKLENQYRCKDDMNRVKVFATGE